MSILSLEYLLYVAIVFILYYLLPLRARWITLLIASLAFYAFSGWRGMAYMTAFSGLTWGSALGVSCLEKRPSAKKALLATVLTVMLGMMALIKYANVLPFVPLGLSWFTFQGAGYVIDVYRGKAKPERNPLKHLLFLSFFPQMTQGPISAWFQLTPQLTQGHRLEPVNVTMGFQRMLWGYFKKLVIADRLAATTAAAISGSDMPGWLILLAAFLYMVRLYADFSGGMDIIRGTAMLLGIQLTENFRQPFFASSVSEYWRRWHISLGTWFRSYLLYPLTTSRFGLALGRLSAKLLGKKVGRLIPSAFATLVIFFLIGIWHGAYWNAAIYGLYFGFVMSASLLLEGGLRKLRKRLNVQEKHPLIFFLRILRTWLLLLPAQYFAFTSSPSQAVSLMAASMTNWDMTGITAALAAVMPLLEWAIALGAILLLAAVDLLAERGTDINLRLAKGPVWLRWPVLLALIVLTVALGCYGEGTGSAAFVYTRF